MERDFSRIKLLVCDFDGVFTDNKVITNENGEESVICSRGDGLGIGMIRKNTDVEILVISTEKNKVVQRRCDKLGIWCITDAEDKLTILEDEIKKRGLSFGEVAFIGNDINDLKCIQKAGIGIAVADSHPEVLNAADLVTKKEGGGGAVREICDLILSSKQEEKNIEEIIYKETTTMNKR